MEHKLVTGGEQFLPFARSRIKALRATGLTYASQSFEVDGVTIRVRIEPGHEYIRVEGGCPKMMSGAVLRGWNVYAVIREVDYRKMQFFFPSEKYSAKQPRAWMMPSAYPAMNERTHGADYMKFMLPYLTHKRPLYSDLVPEAPYTEYTDAPQVAVIRPGMYSGAMRKVIQYMLGAKIPIQFDCRFYCTHGIMNVPGADGKSVPWVIEISARFGVLASRLKVCRKEKDSPEYIPLGSGIPCTQEQLGGRLESGRVIRLLAPEALNNFYENSAVFPECGWAFSYSGLEAQNTGTGRGPVGSIYQTASRYKIVFAHSGGAPSSATIAMVDTGYMISNPGSLAARSQVRIPNYALQGCVTMDMSPEIKGAHSADSICPIYVYYDGEEEQVVTWWNEKPVANTGPDLPDYATEFDPSDKSHYGRPYYVSGNTFGGKCRYYQIKSPVYPTPDLFTWGSDLYTYTPMLHGAGFEGYAWCPPGGVSLMKITLFSSQTGMVVGSGMMSRHTVTIPLYEREMIYHFRETIDYSSSYGGAARIDPRTYATSGLIANYSNFQEIDGTGEPYGPYKWELISITGAPASGGNLSLASDGNLTPAWPASYFGSSWEAPENDMYAGRVTVPPYSSEVNRPQTPDELLAIGSYSVIGSNFPATLIHRYETTSGSTANYRIFDVLPKEFTGETSQLWVSRSADGVHIVPKGERFTDMTEADFMHNLAAYGYPNDLAFSAPWAVFVGDSASKGTK